MSALKIIFMGTAEFACAGLEKLACREDFFVAAVVTQKDGLIGRMSKKHPFSPVKMLAQKLNLPILQPLKARDEQFISELHELEPDLLVIVAYGQILPPAILDLPKFGCLNVHASLLPKYRGAAPIQWAIADGEAETGVTIMKMDTGLDTGPILSARRTPILPTDDFKSLHDRLAQLGAELLVETIPDFVAGKIAPQPQPAEGLSYAVKIKKEDGQIDWHLPAQKIWNRLRAFTPWPGAFTYLPGEKESKLVWATTNPKGKLPIGITARPPLLLKIWKAEVVEKSGALGTVLSADKNGIVVGCGENALRILELQREGGKRLSSEQFLSGFPIKAGSRLG